MSQKGIFVVFEGVEGCGKSTVIKWLVEKFQSEGYGIYLTREPGGKGSDLAEKIRQLILSPENNVYPETEAYLFAASRAQHVREVIAPHIEKGEIVLCDRFVHSSLAYQGVGRKLGQDQVNNINQLAIGKYWPDVVVLLDLDPVIGLSRKEEGHMSKDRIDSEVISFHQTIREAYLKMASEDDRFIIVDASQSLEKVKEDVYRLITEKIKTWK